jgi:hypothetical protein
MIIFDIEASGLHQDSYPIEIAWQESQEPCRFDSFLIRPAITWTHWDDYAETEIHHISRSTLVDKGISIKEACIRLNTALTGQTIYSDAIEYDQRWMMRLFDEADIKPKFSFGSVIEKLPADGELLLCKLAKNSYIEHRALDDARQIAEWVNQIIKEE